MEEKVRIKLKNKYQMKDTSKGSIQLLINNVGIQRLVITFIVLSFDMGRLGKKKKKKKQKQKNESDINWNDLHDVVIMGGFNMNEAGFWLDI